MKQIAAALLLLATIPAAAQQGKIGKTVSNVTISSSKGEEKAIPGWGQKVVMMLYIDPDARDVIHPLTDALKQQQFGGVADAYIVNAKDTWMPNSAIKAGLRKQEAKSPGEVMLIDEKNTLAKELGLGNCNDACIAIVVGADSKLKYTRAIRSREDAQATIQPFFKAINEELGK